MGHLLFLCIGLAAGGAVVFYNYARVRALVPKRFGGDK